MPSSSTSFGPALAARVRENLGAHERVAIPLDGRRHAAVAATLVRGEHGEAGFLITRRAARLRTHAGQWALPGGRLEAGETAPAAALRELAEEVGLHVAPDQVLGLLDDYPTRSGFVITPVVVWGGEAPTLTPDPGEVAEVYRVALSVLEHPDVPMIHSIPESDRPVISIAMLDTHIHAPTAAILYQLREVALHGRSTRVDQYDQPTFAWR